MWTLSGRKQETCLPGIWRRLWYSFLPQFSPASPLATPPKSQKEKAGKNKELPATEEDQVQDHLRNLKVHKSMRPDEVHLQVLRELEDEVAKPLSMISWTS